MVSYWKPRTTVSSHDGCTNSAKLHELFEFWLLKTVDPMKIFKPCPKYWWTNFSWRQLNVGTTDFSAFLQISYYSVLLAAQMDAIKTLLSGKRSCRSIEDQTPVNQMAEEFQTPVNQMAEEFQTPVNQMAEEFRSATAANRQKTQKVSEREYTYQSKLVLQNFVSISHILDNALV